jgi:hypothetical protein
LDPNDRKLQSRIAESISSGVWIGEIFLGWRYTPKLKPEKAQMFIAIEDDCTVGTLTKAADCLLPAFFP